MNKAGETGRLITKKSKKAHKNGDADEYVAYARFVEEALSGYSTLVRKNINVKYIYIITIACKSHYLILSIHTLNIYVCCVDTLYT